MNKAELRKKYKVLRDSLNQTKLDDLSLQIANQVLKLDIWNDSYYHLFLSIIELNEVNTDYILNILSGKDKHVLISKSDFRSGKMNHFLLTDNTSIKKNSYNIPEPIDGIAIAPETIEVVFVPLLAFDKQGHRVGYGKGFYDRFLSECNPKTLKIGLSFFEAENEISGIIESDVKLDYCITPNRNYSFNG
ncbi:5-formyltetrahydrofolate cyclo-ligase [Flavobacteriales bacterium 34_180_T64]|nr:5-formyltetrahydrofolate cyclo-ligase [Flavobacteriales bacterium 34_180_T64]